jgi:hypothetical protein
MILNPRGRWDGRELIEGLDVADHAQDGRPVRVSMLHGAFASALHRCGRPASHDDVAELTREERDRMRHALGVHVSETC